MRKLFFWIMIMVPAILSAQSPVRVMTFNIRFNNPGDGENAWPNRLDMVERLLRFHQPDLMGVQEALPGQMNDLAAMLPDYRSVGIARTEGGEFSAIFYRHSRFDLLDQSTFYLSPTPDRLSTGWDAALPRIVTWARFQDKLTGTAFLHFNTHFDHIGEEARRQSARLILRAIDSLNPEQIPVLLTGDFNATPSSSAIQTLVEGGMTDTRTSSLFPAHGPDGTWTGWTIAGEPGRRIDFVFTKGDVATYRQASLAESFAGRFPSDHLPVMAEVDLAPPLATTGLHAHNDYEHSRPLLEALEAGATSVEADIWLIDGVLRVSHERPLNPKATPTLEELYLRPLALWVAAHGGRVYPLTEVPFQLMIDIKADGEAAFAALEEAFASYRWLPVRVVLSGDRPKELIEAQEAPFFYLDGRQEDLAESRWSGLMPMVSMSYRHYSNWSGRGAMPGKDRESIRELVQSAHAAGATVRLWAVPEEEAAWQELKALGVDWLSVDDLPKGKAFLE